MRTRTAIASAAALLALTACDFEVNDNEQAEINLAAGDESADNLLSISAPGLDMKIGIPEAVRSGMDADSDLLYPGSSLGGMHIEGAEEGGSVELRFTTPDDIGRVSQWYRDAGDRTGRITCAAGGDEHLFACRNVEEGSSFKLHLQPGEGGGTKGILTIQEQ